MVALPLFKIASLFVRHISKYGANRIKVQAHEHPAFRSFAARYGQSIHQLNMRLNVLLLRNPDTEKRARARAEAAEAPTVKTREQVEKELRAAQKEAADRAKYGATAKESHVASPAAPAPGTTVWRRQFRPLPEAKAVDLFADVIGDAFILVIASALVLFEYYRSSAKPDANLERIKELQGQLETLRAIEDEQARAAARQESRILAMEAALRGFRDPKTKEPLLAAAPTDDAPTTSLPAVTAA